jgi:hypothetical protein
MWINTVEPDRPQTAIHDTCATDTHSEYVILISVHGKNNHTKVPQ